MPTPECNALLETLRKHREVLLTLGVKHAYIFGSVARGEATHVSDVDVLVEADAAIGMLGLARTQRELTKMIGRNVDIMSTGAIGLSRHPSILQEAVLAF